MNNKKLTGKLDKETLKILKQMNKYHNYHKKKPK